MFNAIVIRKDDAGYRATLESLDEQQLPAGDVSVDIQYSTLNYKDGLAISGKSPVVRTFPLVAGIDLVGTVTASAHARFKVGDQVVLNGWSVGEKYWGGLAQRACLHGDWLIHLPAGLTPWQSMAIGTAGYTAMLCVQRLQQQGITPDMGEVLVTGANGGVGSFAIAILHQLGYQVVASTGRLQETDYLKALGAGEVIDRQTLSEPGKPLQKERWAAAIDTVGSHTLANVCASTRYNGVVASCGLAQGMDFPGSVAPFILRNVTLSGVDSVMRPYAERVGAWEALAKLPDLSFMAQISHEIPLSAAIDTAHQLLDGQIRGRVVVDVNR